MRTIAHLMVSAGFLLSSGSALAVQHTWNLTGSDKLGSHVAACGSNGSADCQLSFSSDGASLYARAYSTNGSSNSLNGLLIGADIVRYSGSGLGVRNLDEGSSESQSPEHATDNRDRFDIIVFEAPTANFDWDSLGLGWAREVDGGGYANRADIQLYVGNGTGTSMDFTTMCLTGCGTDQKNIMDTDSGFKSVGTFNNIAEGSSFNIPGMTSGTPNTGRYLVVSGSLADSSKFDFFKVSSIKGVKGVPEPQTLALFGIGLIAWLGMSRRRQAVRS